MLLVFLNWKQYKNYGQNYLTAHMVDLAVGEQKNSGTF